MIRQAWSARKSMVGSSERIERLLAQEFPDRQIGREASSSGVD